MCGILGIASTRSSDIGIDLETFGRMRDQMQPRGPDGSGTIRKRNVALGHRLLAIRDQIGGQQPHVSDDGRYFLVYNGELYNDRELRKSLVETGFRSQSQCDTEVVLAAYQRWGAGCVERFRGMFAFAVFDLEDQELFLARDRFGIKPLFYTQLGPDFVFASSIAAILAHPRFAVRPNLAAISHYLTTLRITLDRETVYEGLQQLLPGHTLTWSNGKVRVERYWDYPTEIEDNVTYDEARRELRELLADSVRRRLVADVPVGMFLSGGVDSSTLACLVRESRDERMLGTCGGGESGRRDEFDHARRCADLVDFDYDEVRVSAADYQADWKALIDEYRTPVSTPSDIIIYQIAKSLKRSVGVALGGEGADELLCGYAVQHWAGHDYEASRRLHALDYLPGPEQMVLRASLKQQYGRDCFQSEADHYFSLNSLIPFAAKPFLFQDRVWNELEQDAGIWQLYQAHFDRFSGLTTSDKYARVLHQVNLESLLARLDSATMLASLEARVPYTDHLLVEKMFRVALEHKIAVDNNESQPYLSSAELEARGSLHSKRILRSVAENMMPPELAHRKKASFPTPVDQWLQGEWQDWARDRLRESPFLAELMQRTTLQELSEQPGQSGMWMWPLLNLALWGDREFYS